MEWQEVPDLLEALGTVWPGYRARPGQRRMSRAVAHAMATGLNVAVEGGTGVGKSLAYLLPAALAAVEDGARVLIATSHKHLQDQLIHADLPRVNALLETQGHPAVPATTLKGLANSVCMVGLDEVMSVGEPPPLMPRINEWLRLKGHHGEFEEMPFAVPGALQARLSTGPEECLRKRCAHYEHCWGLNAWRRAEKMPIVITNHALLALHIASDNRLLPGKYDIVIIDEAHAFEDAATRAFGFDASATAIRRALNGDAVRRWGDPATRDAAWAAAAHLDDIIGRLLGRLAAPLQQALLDAVPGAELEAPPASAPRALLPEQIEPGLELADRLDSLAVQLDPQHRPVEQAWVQLESPFDLPDDEMEALDDRKAAALRASQRLLSLANRLRTCCTGGDPLLVYFAESGGGTHEGPQYTLTALPIDVAPFLNDWWEGQSTILTSATLSDGRSFDFVAERLGLGRLRNLLVPSPFDYAHRTRLVLTPVTGQGANDSDYFERLSVQIATLMDAAGGKALVLFTSHRALDEVWRRLASGLRMAGWTLGRQGDSTQQILLQTLRQADEGDRAAVFATRSWWQGVDLPGMRLVIMDKLPFPQLGDPLVAARLSDIDANGGSSFQQYMLPQALIAFRQGFGRLMRTERDYGAVAVCDERLQRRGYGDRFLAALPPDIPTLRSADALRAWIREMQTAPAEASLAATQASDPPFSDAGFSEPEFLWTDEDPPFPTEDPPFSEDF
jgi:ATP-dependent DNA helicase DinG